MAHWVSCLRRESAGWAEELGDNSWARSEMLIHIISIMSRGYHVWLPDRCRPKTHGTLGRSGLPRRHLSLLSESALLMILLQRHAQVFFDVDIAGAPAGRITFELRADVVPKTAGRPSCCSARSSMPPLSSALVDLRETL
jgi:hypothetical protein